MRQEFYLAQSAVRGSIEVDIVRRDSAGGHLALPVQWEALTEQPAHGRRDSAFYLKPDEAQQLADELWRLGVRPSEGAGSAGALRQAESHIDSLKAIAFKLAGVEARR